MLQLASLKPIGIIFLYFHHTKQKESLEEYSDFALELSSNYNNNAITKKQNAGEKSWVNKREL